MLQQKYNVRLTGYDESSAFIGLVGDNRNLQFARQELESALGDIETLELNISLAQPLLRSAKERFCIENLQVCIFSHDTRPSVVLYSLSKSSTEIASFALKQGLFTENITNISSEVCDQLISTLNPPFVDIEQKESNVLVKSYLQQECASVCTALRERMETATSQKIPVQCSPEETAYLIYLHKTDHKAREQLSSLSAEFVVRKSTVFLKGNPQAIQTGQALIRGDFLSQVSTRRFVYQNRRFVSQIKDVVLKPVSDEVIWIIQEQKAPARKQRSRSEEDETEISVIVCSKHREVFQTVCSCLEQVESSHRKLTLRKGAARSIRLNEIKSELEMSYRVRIINRDDFLMIHGLTKNEVCDCAAEILDKVDSCHEITKFIPLTTHQQLFIRHKQDFEELKEDCNELRIVRSKSESEMFSILIRGPIKSVEPVYEKLVGIKNGITTGKFEVNYESKYYHMWKKRCDQIKKDKERTCNIVIDISKEARQQSIPKDEVTTTTIYVVGEESEVFQIGEEISQTATITKTIPLTPIAANTLRKDKKEFLWPLAVYFCIKCQSTIFEAELTAPEDCSEELDTAEEEIQKFLGERTMTSKILTSNNEVVGLVLNSHFKYTTYLSHANSIARNCRIKVYPLKKPQSGLKLSGTPAAILVAEQPLITQVIQPIESSVGQEQLTVKPMFRSVFSTSNFLQFTYKLQEELCVVCTYPRSTRPDQPNPPATLAPKICDPSSGQQEVCVTLRGPRDSLEAAKTKLKKKLDSYMQTEDINIRFALSHQFSSKLENVALKHQVGFSVTESQVGSKKQSLVTLEGINSDVQVVVKTVHQLIIDHQLDRADAEISTPPEWQDQNLTTEVFPVSPKTPEWTRVEQKFQATLSTSRIVSISRIQNTWLWEAYCAHKKRLHLKNNGNVNEKELFHGTRSNDPKLIYEGENGFDMRYSNQGMWGTANYFAVNASYSNNYSYTTYDGCKEIFFVKVLTGDSYRCVSNGSLRKPPQKPRGSAGGKVHFTNMDYDSVTGDTNGSQVFMTYDNDKAYPAYLIKYK